MEFRKLTMIAISVCLILIFALMSVMTGCAQQTPAPPSSQPIALRFAPATAGPPPSMGLTLTTTEMDKLIQSRTNGRVKLEIYWSQALAKGTELVSAIQTGIADAAMLRTFAEPGKIPLSGVGEMPGISDDMWTLLWAYWDLINQEPILSELSQYNMKMISTTTIMEQQLIGRVPIRSLADLKGKKVAASGTAAELTKELGGVPLAMAPPEQYEALLRGTIDAICAPPDAIQAFKFYEVGKYFTKILLGPRIHPVVVNKDVWNKMPKDIQKNFADLVPDLLQSAYTTIMVDTGNVAFKSMKDAGVETIELSAADRAEVQKVRSAFADKWAADMEAKKLAGKKVLSDYRNLAKKYEAKSPYIKK